MSVRNVRLGIVTIISLVVPGIIMAQTGGGVADDIKSLHTVLEQIYDDMMPLCSKLIGVGRGIAGFAATWYIASRIWRHIANAEPIDFYPLFRPFVLGFAILIFPSVIGMINGVMKPTVTGTESMVTDSEKAIAELLKMKEIALKQNQFWQMYVGENGNGDRDQWYRYTHHNENPDDEGFFEGIGNDVRFAMSKFSYNFRSSIKEWISEVLRVFYEGASLCIDTIRTFYLVVLAIIGPLVFGIAVFDGFQHTLTSWIARYMNIFLWLPVANIFSAIMGKIQENMLKVDLQQIKDQGDTFFSSTDMAYLIFMFIGIVGFFTVPSVANYIIHAGGNNAMLYKVTSIMSTSSRGLMGATTSAASAGAQGLGNTATQFGDKISQGFGGYNESTHSSGVKTSQSSWLARRLSGKGDKT